MAILDLLGDEEKRAYHAAFSIFIPVRIYYEKDSLHTLIPKPQSKTLKLHRDHISIKSRYYYEMLKHPHTEGFK